MKILVVGSTGILGKHVVPRLIERGHQVRTIARKPEQVKQLQRLDVDAVLGDILDAESLKRAITGCEVSLHLATAIPKPGGTQDWAPNDRIRREGTTNLLTACQHAGVRRYIQQSTSFLYQYQTGVLSDETTPLEPNPFLQSTLDMEELVKASPLDWSILRGGFFYGPNTFEDAWREALRQGTLPLPGDGSGQLSLIHQVDMATAVVLTAEKASARSIYNVVDDSPVTYKELFNYMAALVGGPSPASGGPLFLPPFACRNDRLKALGWAPAYPSYRSGLA
jgi:nucleoside-diphosphate-sugar epimerase